LTANFFQVLFTKETAHRNNRLPWQHDQWSCQWHVFQSWKIAS